MSAGRQSHERSRNTQVASEKGLVYCKFLDVSRKCSEKRYSNDSRFDQVERKGQVGANPAA